MIVIVDYEMGNVGSVSNILKKIKADNIISTCPDDLLNATKIILPGVGAFDDGIKNLHRLGYLPILNYCVIEKKIPILGICLGMQLFSKQSEEGLQSGFGWLNARTVRFSFDNLSRQLKIPHMGWNTVNIRQKVPLFSNIDEEIRFYFVHSYYMQCDDPTDVLTTTNYGIEFTSAVCRGNILGTQFHPEKSHRFCLEFFKAFLTWLPN
jgi:imidazole glycerol-phosphate synthase subunit HisH